MKFMDKGFWKNDADRAQGNDSTLLFLFFLLGLGVALLGNYFFPWLTQQTGERLTLRYMMVPVGFALLAGSTVFGLYLIPSAALVFGTILGLLSYRIISTAPNETQLLSFFLTAFAAAPAFFLIGTLGMQNASALLQGIRLSGRRAEQEAMRIFFLRWAFFAVLLLCFFFLHGN